MEFLYSYSYIRDLVSEHLSLEITFPGNFGVAYLRFNSFLFILNTCPEFSTKTSGLTNNFFEVKRIPVRVKLHQPLALSINNTFHLLLIRTLLKTLPTGPLVKRIKLLITWNWRSTALNTVAS